MRTLALVMFISSTALAQGLPLYPRPVREIVAHPPDGGTEVFFSGSVSTTSEVHTAPGTWLGVAGDATGTILRVEASGSGGTPVPVSLSAQTLALLAGGRDCARTPINNPRMDGGSTVYVRRVSGQTGVDLVAHDFGSLVDYVSCWPGVVGAGPLANCMVGDGGVGYPLHNQSAVSWDINELTEVNCRACVHGSDISQQSAVLGGGVVVCTPGF